MTLTPDINDNKKNIMIIHFNTYLSFRYIHRHVNSKSRLPIQVMDVEIVYRKMGLN